MTRIRARFPGCGRPVTEATKAGWASPAAGNCSRPIQPRPRYSGRRGRSAACHDRGMTGRDGSAEVVELGSVPGFVVFDLPGAPLSAGGTRLAPDVSVAEVAVLARSMTYKFAALGERVGGAKAGVRGDPADHAARAARMARYCAEIRPLVDAGRFLTGPDMGTSEEDFAPLRERRAVSGAIGATVGGVPFEDVLTGYGVVVAAETALRAGRGGGWQGRSVAIEGFGKVGGGVAREVA